jgi:hypothetical protein
VRDGKNLKGRLIGGFLAVAGKRVLGKGLAETARAIERRDGGAATAQPS